VLRGNGGAELEGTDSRWQTASGNPTGIIADRAGFYKGIATRSCRLD
jgi:hypothetical protein